MPRAASRPKTEQQTMQQATDFREESLTLLALIADLDDVGFEQVTQFKSWTINDVIRHLHFWNRVDCHVLFAQHIHDFTYRSVWHGGGHE